MKTPRVSIVVPNYNYGKVLARRLDSVYGQTFQDFEVILLDDASTDGSAAILASYAKRYPEQTRLSVNAGNTGSPFAQWANGIRQARGELIWIAEADDYAERHLLQSLVEPFDDPAVVLAYAKPTYVQLDGSPARFQFSDYTADLTPAKWDAPYVTDGAVEVREALGFRNTVPNASAALFRSAAARPHIADPLWHRMKMCGDWCFYLRMLSAGKIAYVGEAGAFYAFHESSCASQQSRTPRYLEEHSMVVATIRAFFPSTPPETLQGNFEYLARHFRWTTGEQRPLLLAEWPGVEFSRLWRAEDELAAASEERKRMQSEVGSQGNHSASLEAEASQLRRQIEQSRAECEKARNEAKDLGSRLETAEQHKATIFAESQKLLACYREQVVALEAERARCEGLQRKVTELNLLNEGLRVDLETFRSSTFWRITAPARWAVGLSRSLWQDRR